MNGNIISIEFNDKKSFPPGQWINEPDFCSWDHKLPCMVIRDMEMGCWQGFVGLDSTHPLFGKHITELFSNSDLLKIFLSVHGGVICSGKMPSKYDEGQKLWWLGISAAQPGDLVPLFKNEKTNNTPKQTYKNIHFIRKEVNKLANSLFKIK